MSDGKKRSNLEMFLDHEIGKVLNGHVCHNTSVAFQAAWNAWKRGEAPLSAAEMIKRMDQKQIDAAEELLKRNQAFGAKLTLPAQPAKEKK